MLNAAKGADLVFLDLDNGIEVKSKPVGHKESSKYVTWTELEALWGGGSSLLIYQHFAHESHQLFAERLAAALRDHLGARLVEGFRTAHVLFLLAAQEAHKPRFRRAIHRMNKAWPGQITPMGLATRREPARCSLG